MNQYEFFSIKHARLFYMVRVTLVMSAILLIVRLFELPYGYWALITAATILGAIPLIGGVLTKANQRVWGTLIGGLLGLTMFLIPDAYHWTHHILFLAVLLTAMYFTQEKYSYAAVMVAITVVIVAGGGPADFDAAKWRIINVAWAAVLSVVSSLYVFPDRATRHFIYLLEEFLEQSAQCYRQHNVLMEHSEFKPMHAEKLASLIDKQQALLPHLRKESSRQFGLFSNALMIQKRLYADLETLFSTNWDAQQGKDKISDMPGLTDAKQQLAGMFTTLSNQIAEKNVDAVLQEDIPLLQLVPLGHESQPGDSSDISYYGYLWLNREMARQFSHLTEICSKLMRY